MSNLEQLIRRQPMTERLLTDTGPGFDELPPEGKRLKRSYVWPFQLHASIGPSCALADYKPGHSRIWSGTQNPHMLRVHLSQLLDEDEAGLEIIRHEAAGCYGRNCADDVCADALLLSRAVGAPVRVQLTREQEHGWEPKGAAQLMDVEGSIDAEGQLRHYDFVTHYPSNDAPNLALLLTGRESAAPANWKWEIARQYRLTAIPSSALCVRTCPRLCVLPGCAVCRPCLTLLRMTAFWMSWQWKRV